jgi:hypothetical protein
MPADGIRGANTAQQPCRDRLQKKIADSMAQGIVDLLEPIQIDEQQAHALARWARGGDRLLDAVVEQGAIGQIGEHVVLSEMRHFLRHRTFATHVTEHDDGAGDLTVGPVNRGRGIFDEQLRTISSDQQPIGQRNRLPGSHRQSRRVGGSGPARGVNDLEDLYKRQAGGVSLRPPGESLRRGVQIDHPAIRVRADDPVRNRVQRHLGAFLFGEQQVFDPLAVGDVGAGTEPADGPAVAVAQYCGAPFDQPFLARPGDN